MKRWCHPEKLLETHFTGKKINCCKGKDELGLFQEQKGSSCSWGLVNPGTETEMSREEASNFIPGVTRSLQSFKHG